MNEDRDFDSRLMDYSEEYKTVSPPKAQCSICGLFVEKLKVFMTQHPPFIYACQKCSNRVVEVNAD